MLFYLPMNQPAVIALDRKGLRFGVCIGILMTTVGLWMKAMVNLSFWWVVAGQTIIAMGQPFLLNACAKLSANWFPKKERLRATAVGANAFLAGISAGMFLPSLFVDEETP